MLCHLSKALWPCHSRAVSSHKTMSVPFICRQHQGLCRLLLMDMTWQKTGLGKFQFSHLIVPLPQWGASWNGDPTNIRCSPKASDNRIFQTKDNNYCFLFSGLLRAHYITGQGSNLFVFGSDSKRLSAGFHTVQIVACRTNLLPTIISPHSLSTEGQPEPRRSDLMGGHRKVFFGWEVRSDAMT